MENDEVMAEHMKAAKAYLNSGKDIPLKYLAEFMARGDAVLEAQNAPEAPQADVAQ